MGSQAPVMKLLAVLVGAFASFSHLAAQSTYTCPEGVSSETITVNKKDKLTFKTQQGKKTPNNLNCAVTYEMGTCSKAKLACNFKMKGNGKGCSKGDKVMYIFGTKTTALCGRKGKGKNKNSKGGKCTLRCVKGGTVPAPTPTPTPAPTT